MEAFLIPLADLLGDFIYVGFITITDIVNADQVQFWQVKFLYLNSFPK